MDGLESAELKTLDIIIKQTTEVIESSKEQIFTISENARLECNRVKKELEIIKNQTSETIRQVDEMEKKERYARIRLMTVDRNFKKFTEEDIKKAYETAAEFQLKLSLVRERETQLRLKRDELDRSLKLQMETMEKAEALVSQVGVVLGFIGGNLRDLNLKVESLQQNQQLGLQIILAQEEERKRVAREIHDGPAQSMANVVLRMEFCEKLIDMDVEKLRQELNELKDSVRNTLQDVRKIIFDLRPMALDDLGFVPAIRRYIADFEEKNLIPVKLSINGQEQRFHGALEIALFRLIQESLNNVKKHAKATEVTVSVKIETDYIKVAVKDNGKGFEIDKISDNHHRDSFGLISMQERVELLGGEWDIKSAPGKGTNINFLVPIKRGKEEA